MSAFFACFLDKVRYKSFLLVFCTALVPLSLMSHHIIVAEVSEIVEEFHDGAR